MSAPDALPPLAARREHAQLCAAENRAAIASAWADVEQATVVLEARAHRAVDWTRTLAAITAVLGGIVAVRRGLTRGRPRAGPTLRTLAATSVLRHALPAAIRLYLRRR